MGCMGGMPMGNMMQMGNMMPMMGMMPMVPMGAMMAGMNNMGGMGNSGSSNSPGPRSGTKSKRESGGSSAALPAPVEAFSHAELQERLMQAQSAGCPQDR